MEKSKQQKVDAEAIKKHQAVGADNEGGQAWVAKQRITKTDQPPFNGPVLRISIMGPLKDHHKNVQEG